MAIDMSQFYQVFFDESAEHLAAMEGLLLDLDVENPDSEQLNAIFRAAHSIKGSAGTFGFTDLADTTHILENLLDRIRKQELGLRAEMVDAFLECGDLLREMLEAHQGRGEVDAGAVAAICARLRELSTDQACETAVPQAEAAPVAHGLPARGLRVFDIQFVPTAISAQGDGVRNLLDELKSLGALEVLAQPDAGAAAVGYWQVRLTSDVGQEAFTDQIDFIADNGAWRVLESSAVGQSDDSGFGFFDDSPGAPEADAGYGFFEPLEQPSPANASSSAADGDGYGFFEPLPAAETPEVAAVAAEEGDGYGFFEPVAEPVSTPPAVAEEGDGFGFFAPLPPVVPEPPPVVVEPLVPAVVQPVDKPVAEPRARASKAASAAASGGDSSIRVSIEKVDQLINLVGELVITQAMLLQTATQMQESAPERLVNGLAQLERNTRDLQESVMSIRMMPISFVFSRFPRVVRDLSGKLGKKVELKTTGETTELDKSLIERIADPLTHLIRNSLDHGIESPEARIAAGKSPVGTITLKAYHQGGNIVIEVGDDGAGLPRNKILAKARERGLQVS
ncbi:MAG: Hpt domain-containing protein, partial [Azonexus sp.]|nr:Hpt domain-containing protein [Azonexus sp.]